MHRTSDFINEKGKTQRFMVRRRYSQTDTVTGALFQCDLAMTRCQARTTRGHACRRRSFRHPYCLQHAGHILGLTVGPSQIPGAGCGLFAVRSFRKGDVLLPYTGERTTLPAMTARGLSGKLPYAIGLRGRPAGAIIDSGCTRGLAAYANAGGSGMPRPANVLSMVTTLPTAAAARRRMYWDAGDGDGLCRVRQANPLYRRWGWRRIPAAVLDTFAGMSLPFLVATRHIRAGEEILLDYGSETANILGVAHRTTPDVCR